jgi:hypothetical protein
LPSQETLNTSDNNQLLAKSKSKSKSELLYDWRFTANQFILASSSLRLTTNIFFIFQLNTLTRGWVCRLQLLLALTSTVIACDKLLLALTSTVILGSCRSGVQPSRHNILMFAY